jgi:hypothetical protein
VLELLPLRVAAGEKTHKENKMWISKKKFQDLEALIGKQQKLIAEQKIFINDQAYQVQAAIETASDWRKKYELALLTPKHKAAVEGAQKRGEELFKKKLIAFLMSDVKLRAELPKVKLPKKLKK